MLERHEGRGRHADAAHGKRSFLFLSGGFEYQPGFVMSQYAGGGAASLTAFNIRDISGRGRLVVKRANADEITFYTVDALGLTGEGGSASNDDPLGSRPWRLLPGPGRPAERTAGAGRRDGRAGPAEHQRLRAGPGQGLPGGLDLLHRGRHAGQARLDRPTRTSAWP